MERRLRSRAWTPGLPSDRGRMPNRKVTMFGLKSLDNEPFMGAQPCFCVSLIVVIVVPLFGSGRCLGPSYLRRLRGRPADKVFQPSRRYTCGERSYRRRAMMNTKRTIGKLAAE